MGVYENLPGPATDRLRKEVIQLFKLNKLDITIDMNLNQTNFLDVTLNLSTEKYQPYRKPNNEPLYINNGSNHPPTILKRLPQMVEKRISELSYGPEEFNAAKHEYVKALSDSGLKADIKFNKPTQKNRTRRRKIIYFNPPYNAAVTTNIGREFIRLIDKHFPPQNRYRKIFNRNTIKLSYSCTPNMQVILSGHNKALLKKPDQDTVKNCNCRGVCPLPANGDCRRSAVVYRATVKTGTDTKTYIGSSETEIKLRLANHKHSFSDPKLRNSTRLSAYVHALKDNKHQFEMKWDIIDKLTPYTCGSRRCNLCLTEKYRILGSDPTTTLNARNEIASKCRHRFKYKLRNVR